jgi:hypothetical protein
MPRYPYRCPLCQLELAGHDDGYRHWAKVHAKEAPIPKPEPRKGGL